MCNHENKFLKTVGHRLFCTNCGAELPLEFLTAPKEKPKKQTKKTDKEKKNA